MKKKKRNVSPITKTALYIVLVYVLLATVYSYCSVIYHLNLGVLYYLFLPACYFPTIILQAEREPLLTLIVCQSISALILWPVCWLIIILFKKDKQVETVHH